MEAKHLGREGPACEDVAAILAPSGENRQGGCFVPDDTEVEGDRAGLEPRPTLGRHRGLWLLQLESGCPAPSRRPRRRRHSTEPPGWASSPSSTRQGVSTPEGSQESAPTTDPAPFPLPQPSPTLSHLCGPSGLRGQLRGPGPHRQEEARPRALSTHQNSEGWGADLRAQGEPWVESPRERSGEMPWPHLPPGEHGQQLHSAVRASPGGQLHQPQWAACEG